MIVTVTLTPALDKTVVIPRFSVGEVNRIQSLRLDAGGKGINVAITARRLGIASCVLGCAGKNGIDAVRRKLDGEQVTHAFLLVDGDVRTNMKIVPQDGTGVTELNEPGAPVNAANQRAFSDLLAEKTVAGQYVVLTGSLPPECPPEYYRDLMLSLPEGWDYSRGNFSYALQLCRKNGSVHFHEIDADMGFLDFQWCKAEGYNCNSTETRAKYEFMTMRDYLRYLWNNPYAGQSPYKLFNGIMRPAGKDEHGDVVYTYNESVTYVPCGNHCIGCGGC